MATVTRDSLADRLAEHAEITKSAAREEVKWFFDTIEGALMSGDEVRIHGFGTFKTVNRPASTRRNPRTGEPVKVPAHRALRFSASTTVSTALRGSRGGAKTSGRRSSSR